MKQTIMQQHDLYLDAPDGGYTEGVGLALRWQRGPLGRGEHRKEPNGCFVETVIEAARGRLLHYQGTQFACSENAEAIGHLEAALRVLNQRTMRREIQGVEGTHGLHEAERAASARKDGV